MGIQPATVHYYGTTRRMKMIEAAAELRMIKQVLGDAPAEPRFAGIRTIACRTLRRLATAIVVPGVTRRATV